MITHTTAFEALAKAPIKRTDVIVALQDLYEDGTYHDNAYSIWKSSDVLMSVDIDAVGQFLGTSTKKATVRLMGIVKTMSPGNLYQIRLGLYNQDPSVQGYDYVSQGFFVIDDIAYDYDRGSTTVTMYDQMWGASQTPYAAGVVAFPMTVNELAIGISQAIGVDLMDGFENLPNADYIITEDLYVNISGATLQTVVAELAATTGTTARISDMTLTFAKYQVVDERLDSNLLKTLKLGKFFGPITSVILGRVPQNDNVVVTNKAATATDFTAVNTTTDTITLPGHGLENGTLIQVASTGTLPAGIEQYINYYARVVDLDNFKLSRSWYDATHTGTDLVNITTQGTGTVYLTVLPQQEIQINNVEIMDDDRALLLPPLFGELLGAGWYEGNATTIGLPWHEVGDAILFQQVQDGLLVPVLLQEIHLKLAGSIQETLVSTIPDQKGINHATAGGVLKTIYNTEIKVDKQNNEIQSIVSQQITDGLNTQTAFTEVNQRIDNVTTQIQSVGGGNNLLNSVGYAKETNGNLSFWTKAGTGVVTSYSSAGSLAAGATSGNAIQLRGAVGTKITQRISVATNSAYSIGFYANKQSGDGSVIVRLVNDVTNFELPVELDYNYTWTEIKLENITPGQNYWDVVLEVTDATTSVEITDLRVMNGPTLVQWDQSHSEILNTQVALTTEGIRVSSNVFSGDYTVMTPLEFAGYSNASGTTKKVFWVNRETTQMANAQIDGVTNFNNVIRAIPIASGAVAGLAFVGAVS